MTNAEWMIKNGYKFSDLCCCFDDITGDIIISLYGIILARGGYAPFDDFLKRWLDKEHEEESILNNAEKKYLSAVIKPFRDRVDFICKVNAIERCRYQNIVIGIGDSSVDIYLPPFETETMYKGMKPGHEYTLEELGI